MLLSVAERGEDAGITVPAEFAFLLVLAPFGLLAFWIATIVTIAKYREDEFRAVRSSKTTWLVLVCLVAWVAPIFYATVHRRLRRHRAEQAASRAAVE